MALASLTQPEADIPIQRPRRRRGGRLRAQPGRGPSSRRRADPTSNTPTTASRKTGRTRANSTRPWPSWECAALTGDRRRRLISCCSRSCWRCTSTVEPATSVWRWIFLASVLSVSVPVKPGCDTPDLLGGTPPRCSRTCGRSPALCTWGRASGSGWVSARGSASGSRRAPASVRASARAWARVSGWGSASGWVSVTASAQPGWTHRSGLRMGAVADAREVQRPTEDVTDERRQEGEWLADRHRDLVADPAGEIRCHVAVQRSWPTA